MKAAEDSALPQRTELPPWGDDCTDGTVETAGHHSSGEHRVTRYAGARTAAGPPRPAQSAGRRVEAGTGVPRHSVFATWVMPRGFYGSVGAVVAPWR